MSENPGAVLPKAPERKSLNVAKPRWPSHGLNVDRDNPLSEHFVPLEMRDRLEQARWYHLMHKRHQKGGMAPPVGMQELVP